MFGESFRVAAAPPRTAGDRAGPGSTAVTANTARAAGCAVARKRSMTMPAARIDASAPAQTHSSATPSCRSLTPACGRTGGRQV